MAQDVRFGKPRSLIKPSTGAKPFGAKPAVAPGSGQAKGPDGRLQMAAGDDLFMQGDQGGDLYFIAEGTVEIYTQREGETITLAMMGPGEIIGVMTCLTNEPRMASARAKTIVACKKVPHSSIKKVLEALPNWMKIVLKEFTLRLTQMNKLYGEAVVRIKKLEATQVSNVYIGAQIAAAFATISEYLAIKYEDTKIVVVDDVLDKLEPLLNLEKKEIDRVFAVLLEAGLLKVEVESDKKRSVSRLANAQKMVHFAAFVKETKHGPAKKLLKARFTHKETRVLSALVKLGQKLGVDMEKTCKFALKELERTLEKSTGVKFEKVALDKGVLLKLVELQGEGDTAEVVFKPSALGRTVACIEAVRKLTALDNAARGVKTDDAA